MPEPPQLPLSAIRQPAFLYGPDGRITATNDRAEALAGRQLIGCSAADVIAIFGNRHPDGALFLPEELPPSRALAGEEAIDVPIAVTAADGRTVHILATASPITDRGETVGALVIWQDVSFLETAAAEQARLLSDLAVNGEELRNRNEELMAIEEELRQSNDELLAAQQRLRESEERFHSVLDNTRDVLVRMNLQTGRYEYVSPSVEALVGYSPDAFSSMDNETALAMIHPEDLPVLRAAMARSVETGAAEVEYRQHTRSGEIIWVSNRMSVIADRSGRPLYRINSIRDITGQRRTEDSLRRISERHAAILESISDSFMSLDRDWRFTYINQRAIGYADLSPSDVIGRSVWEVYPEILGTPLEAFYREAMGSGEPLTYQNPSVVATGRTFELRAYPTHEGVSVFGQDITERRQAEAALRESEEKYHSIAELSPDGIVVHRGGRLLYLNPAAARLLRRETPGALIGTNILDLVHPDDRPKGGNRIDEVQQQGHITPLWEFRFLIDGETVDADATASQVSWEGAPAVQVILREITERKRTDRALRAALAAAQEGEEVLTALMDSVPEGITIADADLRIRMVSRFGQDFLGGPHAEMSTGEVIGRWRTYREDGVTPLPDAELPLVRAIRSGETVRDAEIVQVNEAGRALRLLCNAAPIRDADGSVTGAVVAWRDISEQWRAEAALRESEARFRSLSETSPIAISVTTADGRTLYVNRAHEALFGYTWGDPERAQADDFYCDPGDRETMLGILREQGNVRNHEVRLRRRDGTPFWVSLSVSPIAFGGEQAILGLITDITERKGIEESLRINAENLRRSNEDLERFAYVSSHDLQEPLRAIVSFSQLLERRYRGQLDTDADEYIDFIVEGGTRMQTLIQDLLAYSRVNTTRQDLHPTSTEDVMAAVERNLDVALRESGAMITHDPMPVVLADPLQLEQVFANLVSNAIKFRRADEPLRIHVGARRMDGFWEFSVSDNGIGIEPEYYDRIFVIFQRLHTKDVYPGTGIGLAIVKRIIDRHGGTIRVESTPGEGSTFSFTLPAA